MKLRHERPRAARPAACIGTAATLLSGLILVSSLAVGQNVQRSRAIANSDVLSQISMFAYEARRKSDLILRPTPVIATGEGTVEVEYEDGNAEIAVDVRRMPAPSSLGPYTTYVVWALTPDGRANNEGALVGPDGGSGDLETQYPGAQFALIVTAEPPFAVSSPSTMIVLYNVADNVRGSETKVSSVTEQVDYRGLEPIAIDERSNPVESAQAQYAVAIAESAGAAQYAETRFSDATGRLEAARNGWLEGNRSGRRDALVTARGAVTLAEDALRAALINRAEAEAEARRQAAAEAAAAEERARAEAAAAAERERVAAERAEAARQAEEATRLAAEAAALEAEAQARAAARQELIDRLSAVLPTRATDRGLVSEIGGVQFATGTANLNTGAREGLARFSGIVASYPDLRFTIEGHTDNVGSAENNRELSLRRAISVRDYLIGQGVAASAIEVEAFGFERPVADNETAEGRARNRRVEIVITGGPLVQQ